MDTFPERPNIEHPNKLMVKFQVRTMESPNLQGMERPFSGSRWNGGRSPPPIEKKAQAISRLLIINHLQVLGSEG